MWHGGGYGVGDGRECETVARKARLCDAGGSTGVTDGAGIVCSMHASACGMLVGWRVRMLGGYPVLQSVL